MPKSNNHYQLLDDGDLVRAVAITDQANLKFNLYLRSKEMKEIAFYLEKIMLKQKNERETFIDENKAIIESLTKIFVDNFNLTLEGIQMDQEAIQLSMQLAMDLRKSMALINTLLYSGADLAS
jgi:hypothetical protein